ncbi:S-adenosylmethionine synthetase N-terminal domain-containing protein [Aerococcaceae bacterium NML191219]|nr:S-adenosylmethionine synthetase N-terminal domain-containing protein [Aerococcaceae bacterium NML191219]
MIEKVNPSHPDKLADIIAGAIVDLAYTKEEQPKIAVEVLIGHGLCYVMIETTTDIVVKEVNEIIKRLSKDTKPKVKIVSQDEHLRNNQTDKIRCGDNGIFKGVPIDEEQSILSSIARNIYQKYPSDGKYILDNGKLIICQSQAQTMELKKLYPNAVINPLGDWTGGTNVDTGATNRKLGSDMGSAVTGGGLHGKDLSKADVSVNIYAHLKAQRIGEIVELSCAIGDEEVDGKPYKEIVNIAKEYIDSVGGFEEFAKWGLF